MKCIILLSFVALCYSFPYGTGYGSRYGYGYGLKNIQGTGFGGIYGTGKTFNVNQDGSFTITTTNGKIITISKVPGQTNVVVTATEPTGNQAYQYYGYQKYQPTQADILAKILTQYQGDVTQNVYQQLLGDVNSAVQAGQLNTDVYQALQNLNQLQGQVGQTQGVYTGYPFQGQVYGGVQTGQMAQQLQELEQAQQIQQLVQQVQNQQYQQGVPVYVAGAQQNQYPYGQQQVVVPVVDEQGQIVEKVILQKGYSPNVVGTGISSLKGLMNNIFYGNTQQQKVGQYDQYYPYGSYGQSTTGQLHQIVGQEKVILNQQNQIQQEQIQQQQQQQQLQQQQLQQQLQQQQQQNQQQYVQDAQEQVQKEQEQVLLQQQQLQQQMQQQQQYNTVQDLFAQTKGQQIFSQQKPGFYSQGGLFGAYGQGIHGYNVPLVY